MILTDRQIEEYALLENINGDTRVAFIDGMRKYRSLLTDSRELEVRKEEFRVSVLEYLSTYSPKTLDSFYKYWSESNRFGKMKFEKEPTWSLKGRLATWFKNEKKFSIVGNLNKRK